MASSISCNARSSLPNCIQINAFHLLVDVLLGSAFKHSSKSSSARPYCWVIVYANPRLCRKSGLFICVPLMAFVSGCMASSNLPVLIKHRPNKPHAATSFGSSLIAFCSNSIASVYFLDVYTSRAVLRRRRACVSFSSIEGVVVIAINVVARARAIRPEVQYILSVGDAFSRKVQVKKSAMPNILAKIAQNTVGNLRNRDKNIRALFVMGSRGLVLLGRGLLVLMRDCSFWHSNRI